MPRPPKPRRVCALPRCQHFGPLLSQEASLSVSMSVDEFETIRWIDLEGLSQEECANNMNVARTTVQAIYAAARHKLAQCLVKGAELRIEGGDYRLCEGEPSCRPCHGCEKHRRHNQACRHFSQEEKQ
ncbi:MAG: DUF134 domain-containing protein [Eubacteriales bacterium]|nr:DUF134 domain-containing protein [Eubacteriales bacterium]